MRPDRGQQITLVIENNGFLPLKLKKDHVIGHMLPADPIGVLEADHHEESTDRVAHLVASVGRSDGSSDHAEQLLKAVEIGDDNSRREQDAKLKGLLVANAGVFALDSFELGTTDVVTHAVNTGDHRPVRQHPRRIPFALHGQVTQMVEDMLVNQVIQPSSSPWASPVVLVEKKDGSFLDVLGRTRALLTKSASMFEAITGMYSVENVERGATSPTSAVSVDGAFLGKPENRLVQLMP